MRAFQGLCMVLFCVAAAAGHAQQYPAKLVRLLVGFPPGGTNDIVARIVAQKVTEQWGQSMIVENRGGANTAIATEIGARAAPDIPTVAEAGVPGYEVTTFYGMSAPAKTPRAIIERLHGEFTRALKSPDVRDRLVDSGAEPVGSSPEEYTAFMVAEIAKWAKVIKAAGIKGE